MYIHLPILDVMTISIANFLMEIILLKENKPSYWLIRVKVEKDGESQGPSKRMSPLRPHKPVRFALSDALASTCPFLVQRTITCF